MTPKVLFLSRNYPNNVVKVAGMWVEGLARHVAKQCDVRVVAPVPYCPPLPRFVEQTKFREVKSHHHVNGVEVTSPRFLTGPGYSLHNYEANALYWSIRSHVDRLHRAFPFDIIHAHFSYPEGVVAARFARRYKVPLIITEHAAWQPWMDDFPRVRRQAMQAFEQSRFLIAGSTYLRNTIAHFTGDADKLRLIPIGVDESVFTYGRNTKQSDSTRIIYVGRIHKTKGIDILLHALRKLVDQKPEIQLVMVGGSLGLRDYRLQEEEMRQLAEKLGLGGNISYVGMKPPAEVAHYIRESALLVLPSRRESFGAVLIEAMATGIPVVATKCGGPEDFVTDETGILVPKEDADALANGIEHVLDNRNNYDPEKLHAYAVNNYSWDKVANQVIELYKQALH